jgi:nucleotide-binding universal stress UspA family protein
MKSILLHIDHDRAMPARLQVALDMARATNGHITCLQAVSYDVFMPGDFYGSAMAAALPVIKENADKLRADTERALEHEGVPFDWRFEYGVAAHRLIAASPLADIMIVGPAEAGSDGRGPSALVGDVVLRAAVPVLVVPEGSKSFDVGAPMVVAWNGSAESAHALRAAVPLLACSCQVTLACVVEDTAEGGPELPSTDGAKYLARHGITCEIVEIPRGGAKIADTLFAAATLREASLLVMGAYGHPRLAELVLGGVTRHMLSEPQMPVLLAH